MTVHSNAWLTQKELSKSLMKSRGMVYSLLPGQCTEVPVEKMKQDNDWVAISTLCDPNLLFKLIKRFALNQLDNHNKTGVLTAEKQSR